MKKIITDSKICIECGKEFYRPYGRDIKRWNEAKFCSHSCYSKSLKGKKKEPRSKETKRKISEANSGEGNGMYGKKAWNSGTKGLTKANSGSFEKGLISWNKGTVGVMKANSGSFKKKKISLSKKIIKVIKIAIKKISNKYFKKKRVAWNKGLKCPSISKSKMGKKRPDMIGNIKGFQKGMIPWCKGLKGIHLSPQSEFKRGDNIGNKNANWKGGITISYKRIRNCFEYKEWRKKIFERDNYTCQMYGCNKTEKRLHIHHKKEFSVILKRNNIETLEEALKCEKLWEISNGITYCKLCHEEYHKKQRQLKKQLQQQIITLITFYGNRRQKIN